MDKDTNSIKNRLKTPIASEEMIKFHNKIVKIRISAFIFAMCFPALIYFYGFTIGMFSFLGIFLLIILSLGIKNLIQIIRKNELNKFCNKYKAGVVLFSFNVVFDVVIWLIYFALSAVNQERYIFHFVILSSALLVCSIRWVVYKYFSEKSFIFISWPMFDFIFVFLPPMFFLSAYIMLRGVIRFYF